MKHRTVRGCRAGGCVLHARLGLAVPLSLPAGVGTGQHVTGRRVQAGRVSAHVGLLFTRLPICPGNPPCGWRGAGPGWQRPGEAGARAADGTGHPLVRDATRTRGIAGGVPSRLACPAGPLHGGAPGVTGPHRSLGPAGWGWQLRVLAASHLPAQGAAGAPRQNVPLQPGTERAARVPRPRLFV